MSELAIENQWICSSVAYRYTSHRLAHFTSEYSLRAQKKYTK